MCIQPCNLFIAEVAEGLSTVAEFKQNLLGRESRGTCMQLIKQRTW